MDVVLLSDGDEGRDEDHSSDEDWTGGFYHQGRQVYAKKVLVSSKNGLFRKGSLRRIYRPILSKKRETKIPKLRQLKMGKVIGKRLIQSESFLCQGKKESLESKLTNSF